MDWSTSEQQTITSIEGEKRCPSLGVDIFDGLSLIQDHILPFQTMENFIVWNDQIVWGHNHMKMWMLPSEIFLVEVPSNGFPLVCLTPIWKHPKAWAKLFKFLLPIMKCGWGSNHKKGSPNILMMTDEGQQRYGLDGLSESHFISQNTVNTLLVQIIQPS